MAFSYLRINIIISEYSWLHGVFRIWFGDIANLNVLWPRFLCHICGMHYLTIIYVLTIIFSAHNTFYCFVSVMSYLSILCIESLLHTGSPLLKTSFQPLPTKASSTPVSPATFKRRWPFIY